MSELKLARRDSLRNIAMLGIAGAAVASGATVLTSDKARAAGQPHMEQALADLQSALYQLQLAWADKGGHRVKAIALVKDAIDETTRGMIVGSM